MAGSSFFSEHLKHMFHSKQIAAVLIAMCLASTGDAASRLEPPGAAEKMTIQPRGRAPMSVSDPFRTFRPIGSDLTLGRSAGH